MAQFIQKWEHHTKDPIVRKTYGAWLGLRRRCTNPKDKGYSDYGGRGIRVCERWMNDFNAFVTDMGFAPWGTSIERIDVGGNYDPFNCTWATRKEQANNTRKNVKVTLHGRAQTATQWAEELGIPTTRFLSRIRRGWTPEQAANPRTYEAPHGGDRCYVLGCRCEICVDAFRRRKHAYYRKRHPVIKNSSRNNPDKKYDL